MLKNKGSIEQVVILIVFIVLLILLMQFSFQIIEKIKDQTQASQCKTSVLLLSKLAKGGHGFKEYVLSCPIKFINLTKEKDVFPSVAKEMAHIWNEFGEGKLELFEPKDEVYCVLGSYIQFKDINKQIPGLLPYLAEHAYQKTNYLEYLTGVNWNPSQKQILHTLELQKFDNIDTTKPLGIIFIYSKNTKMTKQEGAIMGAGIGTVVGVVGGIATLFYFPPAGISILGYTLISPIAIGAAQVATGTAISSFAGASTGYYFGHDESSEWDARILAVPFTKEEISRLPCTYWPVPVK